MIKTIVMGAFKWFPILLVVIALGAIAWGVKGCVDTNKENDVLKADTTVKGVIARHFIAKADSLGGVTNLLTRQLNKADSIYTVTQAKHKRQLLSLENYLASSTAEQQRDTVLKIIRIPDTKGLPIDSNYKRPYNQGISTVLPANYVVYSPEQNKAITEAVINEKVLSDQREEVTRLQANQEARIELIGVRVKEAIGKEKKRKHLLGIGQDKGLEDLKKTTDYIIETTY